jgi:hypothetical protein
MNAHFFPQSPLRFIPSSSSLSCRNIDPGNHCIFTACLYQLAVIRVITSCPPRLASTPLVSQVTISRPFTQHLPSMSVLEGPSGSSCNGTTAWNCPSRPVLIIKSATYQAALGSLTNVSKSSLLFNPTQSILLHISSRRSLSSLHSSRICLGVWDPSSHPHWSNPQSPIL